MRFACSISRACEFLSPPHSITTTRMPRCMQYSRYPGPWWDAQFGKSFPNGFSIAKVAQGHPVKPGMNAHPRLTVFQVGQPAGKGGALDDFEHEQLYFINYR